MPSKHSKHSHLNLKHNFTLTNVQNLQTICSIIIELIEQILKQQTPCLLYLEGDLGAGKTTCMRYLLESIGYKGLVKSPSYSILESYDLSLNENEHKNQLIHTCHHLDAYRIHSDDAWYDHYLQDYFDNANQHTLIAIEWAQHIAHLIAPPHIIIQIEIAEFNPPNQPSKINEANEANKVNEPDSTRVLKVYC